MSRHLASREWRGIVTDLDGTLLCSDGTLSPTTVHVLGRLAKRGGAVIAATARPLFSARQLLRPLNPQPVVIASNGACAHVNGSTLVVGFINEKIGTTLIHSLVSRHSIRAKADSATESQQIEARRCGPIPILSVRGVTCIAVSFEDDPEACYVECADLAHELGLGITRSEANLFEFLPPGISKGSTLRYLCTDHLGIAMDHLVAFGDMENDIPLFDACGLSFAISHAPPTVRLRAVGSAPSNDDDGVAQVITQLRFTTTPEHSVLVV
jgi:hydroxymethylpyrimidine pyrophosphatase-like HAD family hydrolase